MHPRLVCFELRVQHVDSWYEPLAGQKEAERTALCCGAERHKLSGLGNN